MYSAALCLDEDTDRQTEENYGSKIFTNPTASYVTMTAE